MTIAAIINRLKHCRAIKGNSLPKLQLNRLDCKSCNFLLVARPLRGGGGVGEGRTTKKK